MVGSTLVGGPDWADAARCLVAGEVDRGVLITLMLIAAVLAGPVLRPADLLPVLTVVADLRGRVEPVRLNQP